MNGDNVVGGQTIGLGQARPDQARAQIDPPMPTPIQPGMADRMISVEERETISEQRLLKAEQVCLKLIGQCHEYRQQLGLQPLGDDYFIS